MGKRKRIADKGTYQRIFIGKALRAPKGKRWTKPKVILQGLESRIVAATVSGDADPAHVANLRVLHELAKYYLDTWGNKGNVYLEYAWDTFVKRGKVLDRHDLTVAANNGAVNRWHRSICGGRRDGVVKSEVVMSCSNPDRLRAQIQAAKAAKPKVDKHKAIGDKIRAEALAAKQRRANYAHQFKQEQALMESLRATLKGA